MLLEDRGDYVDLVAQAVIDKIEERDRLARLLDLVAHRGFELQEQQAAAESAEQGTINPTAEERRDAGD